MAERTPPRATDSTGLLLGDLSCGTRVGDYMIERSLPTRGTGHLYEAFHVVLPRHAIIRVIPSAGSAGPSVARELLREACIVDALDHPGIPRVFECGVLADRRPWIATEHIWGVSVAAKLALAQSSYAEVTAVVRDVADVLAHSHARGVVHRHVVPSAIVFPTPARRFPLCLVDWSMARACDSTSPLPPYPVSSARPFLAPEQLAGEAPDPSGDVYSLGAIARELMRHAHGTAPPILQSLVTSMVSENPHDRPTSAQVLDTTAWLGRQVDDAVPRELDLERTEPVSM